MSENPAAQRPLPFRDLLGVGNTGLVVTGLMLPVGGAIARFVTLFSPIAARTDIYAIC